MTMETEPASDISVGVASQDPFFLFAIEALLGKDRSIRLMSTAKSLAAMREVIDNMPGSLDAIVLDLDSVCDTPSLDEDLYQLIELTPRPKLLCMVEGTCRRLPKNLGGQPCDAVLSKWDIGYAIHLAIRAVVERDTVLLTERTADQLQRSRRLPRNAKVVRPEKKHPDLTDRLYEVAKLRAVVGLDNRDIADELQLSRPTVRKYISRIYQALGVDNEQEALREVRAFEALSGWWWVDRFPG